MDIINITVSNRATMIESFQLIDENGDAVTLTGATINYEAREKKTTSVVLSATTDDGVTIAGTTATIRFEETEMDGLDPGEYYHGCTVQLDGETDVEQIFTGTLNVVDGIVS